MRHGSIEKTIYGPDDKLRDLVDDNAQMLTVIGRFDISLGFGDNTIREVCRRHDIDCTTFLSVANFLNGRAYDSANISLRTLMEYLKNAHSYFMDFLLPRIKQKLFEAIGANIHSEGTVLILKFFDEYTAEVSRHMTYENNVVFAYVNGLLEGHLSEGYSIAGYSAGHTNISSRLKDLKNIIIRHYPQRNSHALNSVLLDLLACEQDLMYHCLIEDKIFVPAVENLEQKMHLDLQTDAAEVTNIRDAEDQRIDTLTEREKEVIRCVARGMSNKEIAEALCLSVHTVTTYRRNLSAKLDIHSPAGLTIFAIIHKLVHLDEIALS